MIDINELRQSLGAVQSEEVAELLDRLEAAESDGLEQARLNGMGASREAALMAKLEAAEKERVIDEQRIADLMAELNRVGHEIESLRTKIEAMEKQGPVAEIGEQYTLLFVGSGSITGIVERHGIKVGDKLYLAPGAQSTPFIPEGWKPIPENCPTFDLVDLRLADGSVLCGCVPQSDGDYWWEGPSGEVFIDPKYAPVTHWRLAATQEAKP